MVTHMSARICRHAYVGTHASSVQEKRNLKLLGKSESNMTNQYGRNFEH